MFQDCVCLDRERRAHDDGVDQQKDDADGGENGKSMSFLSTTPLTL